VKEAGVPGKFDLTEILKDYVKPSLKGKEIEALLGQPGSLNNDVLILMHIGTSENFSLRRWPVQRFSELANRLIDAYQTKIIFTGLSSERQLINEAKQYIENKDKSYIIDTGGQLTFKQFVSIIQMSDLVISGDTSAVHIASYFLVPVIGLYGPNTPILYGPWNQNSMYFYENLTCSPCITNYNAKINKCRNPEGIGICMQKITVNEVFRAIEEDYLKRGAKHRFAKLMNKC
jgi:ADP-heptose:LPS heptosyltransferase